MEEIKRFVHGLGPSVSPRYVTERRLRPLCALPWNEQLSRAEALWPSSFCRRSAQGDGGTSTKNVMEIPHVGLAEHK